MPVGQRPLCGLSRSLCGIRNLNGLAMKTIPDWNRRPIKVAQSRGGVLVTTRPEENLIRTGVSPWPPPEIVQKLYQSRQIGAFDGIEAEAASAVLGFYTDMQSLQSEDAVTWSVFGPLIYQDDTTRRRFTDSLFKILGLPCRADGPVCMWLWRRLPHPDMLVSGGPEIDFGIQASNVLVLGEAKWRSPVGAKQGVAKDKDQILLRREFLEKYGEKVYPSCHHFVVLGVSISGDLTSNTDLALGTSKSLHIRDTTWDILGKIEEHPLTNELQAYYRWKLYRTHTTIRWKEVEEINPMRGHGVEFFHEDYGKIPTAFLEGYKWQKDPRRKVTVEILHHSSTPFASGSKNPSLVLEDIREAVQYFLLTPNAQKQDIYGGKVTAWFNG
jgi:hypothetical protein